MLWAEIITVFTLHGMNALEKQNYSFKVGREVEKIPPPCHFDVESGTFKGKFGTLMWPSGTLMFTFKPLFLIFFNKKPFRPCNAEYPVCV